MDHITRTYKDVKSIQCRVATEKKSGLPASVRFLSGDVCMIPSYPMSILILKSEYGYQKLARSA